MSPKPLDPSVPWIVLVRHGESRANTGEANPQRVGDPTVELTERGQEQARQVGAALGAELVRSALVYVSPYRRTRQTLEGILQGAGVEPAAVRVFEDPRLREVEHGYGDVEGQQDLREVHGWFYYRFEGGESPADCYDRTSSFLESLMRQGERKGVERALVVTHGLTIRCFAMRFLHLSVEQFEQLANPRNCDVITIGPRERLEDPLFVSGKWGVTGLRLRPPEA